MNPTCSHVAEPSDRRCSWLQLIAAPEAVAAAQLEAIDGAGTLPGKKARAGSDHELPAWTFVFDIEANHPTKKRGWRHLLGIVVPAPAGPAIRWINCDATVKAAIKEHGGNPMGSGPNAAMVRAAQWVLRGQTDAERLACLAVVAPSVAA